MSTAASLSALAQLSLWPSSMTARKSLRSPWVAKSLSRGTTELCNGFRIIGLWISLGRRNLNAQARRRVLSILYRPRQGETIPGPRTMAGLTSEQFDVIARLANQGLSGRDLREAVYDKLGVKLGRNQIGGILYRLRASKKVTVRPDKIRATARHAARSSHSVPSVRHDMPMFRGPTARFAPSPVFHEREAAPSSPQSLPALVATPLRGPATLFDLQRDSCRWPLWDDAPASIDDKLFCNEVRHGDGPYCCAHARESLNRHDHPVSIRNAANVKKAYFD